MNKKLCPILQNPCSEDCVNLNIITSLKIDYENTAIIAKPAYGFCALFQRTSIEEIKKNVEVK